MKDIMIRLSNFLKLKNAYVQLLLWSILIIIIQTNNHILPKGMIYLIPVINIIQIFLINLGIIYLILLLFIHCDKIFKLIFFLLLSLCLINNYALSELGSPLDLGYIDLFISYLLHTPKMILLFINTKLVMFVVAYLVAVLIFIKFIKLPLAFNKNYKITVIAFILVSISLTVLLLYPLKKTNHKQVTILAKKHGVSHELRFQVTSYSEKLWFPYSLLKTDTNPNSVFYSQASDFTNFSFNNKAPKTIIIWLAESISADKLEINGYNKHNMPYLSENPNLFSFFPNTKACASNTFRSHPCMFSPISSKDSSDFFLLQNLSIHSIFDIFHNKGYKIELFVNRKGFQEMSLKKMYLDTDYMKIHDTKNVETNLVSMQKVINYITTKANEATSDSIFLMWNYIDHLPYNYYPKNLLNLYKNVKFTQIKNQKKDDLTIANAYSNNIIYTDYILFNMVKKLNTNKNILLLYISDHGENIEDPKFSMHGGNISKSPKTVLNPAFAIWTSAGWNKNIIPNHSKYLKSIRHQTLDYEELFYDLLQCGGITSKEHDNSKNLLCKGYK